MEIWHGNRNLADVVVTINLGSLASWEFGDLKSYSHWVSMGVKVNLDPSPVQSGHAPVLGLTRNPVNT